MSNRKKARFLKQIPAFFGAFRNQKAEIESDGTNALIEILVVSDFHPLSKLGGAPAIAFEYFETLKEKGVTTEFLTLDGKLSEAKDLNNFNVKIKEIGPIKKLLSPVNYIKNSILFIIEVLRLNPTYIWIHSIGNIIPFLSLYILSILKIDFFVTLHDFNSISRYKIGAKRTNDGVEPLISTNLFSKLYRKFNIGALKQSLFCAYLSSHQERIFKHVGLNNLVCIPNGVSLCEHDYKDDLRQQSGALKILFAGRANMKGLLELLEALKSPSKVRIEIYLAGDQELLDFVADEFSNSKIFYLGNLTRSDLQKFIHEVHIVLVNSQYFDPYPTIGLEGIRHNALVITSECSGILDLFSTEDLKPLILPIGNPIDFDRFAELYNSKKNHVNQLSRIIPTPHEVVDRYLCEIDKVSECLRDADRKK